MVLRTFRVAVVCATVLAAPPLRAEEPERAPERETNRPEETHGLPPGFHEESRVRWGAVIGGGVPTLAGALLLAGGIMANAEASPPVESGTSSPDNDIDSTATILMV